MGLYIATTILVAVFSYGLGYFNGETEALEKVKGKNY